MKADPDLRALQDGAIAAARAAGQHALANVHRRGEALSRAHHDVKLALDVECQARASDVIRAAFPGHAILGEEDADTGPRPGAGDEAPGAYLWVIDPIDGTVNFSHGLRFWCCSVAVQHRGETVAGSVYAPAMEELYSARRRGGAWRNGEPIKVSTVADPAAAVVMTGLDKDPRGGIPPLTYFSRIASACQRPRVVGCAALDLCQVACGRADAYFESGIYIWDVAAAGLMVEEAGGKAEKLASLGGHRLQFLATNGRIHEELRALLTAPS